MGIAISILIGAVGAILRYAFTGPVNQNGFNLDTAGMILIVVGIVGLVVSLVWTNVGPFGRRASSVTRRDEVITQDGREQGRTVSETRDQSVM